MAEEDEATNDDRIALRPIDEALGLVEIAHFQGVDAWRRHIQETPPTDGALVTLVLIIRNWFEQESDRLGISFEEVVRQVRLQAMDAVDGNDQP